MNFGSILGSISPAFGIASGQGIGALLKGAGGHSAIPAVDPAGAVAPPTVASNAAPPAAPPAAAPGQMLRPVKPVAPQPQPTGGMHGVAFGGHPNIQGILAGLGMMAPGARRF